MNRPICFLLLATFIAVGVVTVSGQAPSRPQAGFLTVLKEGQSINVKEVAGRFEFTTLDDGLTVLSHMIIEVGPDYLTIGDISRANEVRISVYSIKSIVTFKVPK